jgi:hypothetical protein
VVAKVRERIAVNKQGSHRFHMERFNLKKLNEVEDKEQYRVEVSNRFAALEDLDAEVEINSVWETIRENIKISAKESLVYFELKKHKPWFEEGCSKLLDQRKQAKLQWLQYPSEINGDNLNNVRLEASRYFRKQNEGISGDMLADSYNILNRWKNYLSQLLNVYNVSDVGLIGVHMAEPLVPGPSSPDVEIAIVKLKKYTLPCSDEIPAELIQAGGEILQSAIQNSLILFRIRKNCLINGRSLLLYQFTKRLIKLTLIIIVGYHCYQLHTKFYRISYSQD